MPARVAAGGALVEVWVQPRASRDQVVGLQGEAVKVRLTAPPVEGEANEALVRFLAKQVGVPRRDVEIVAGVSSRRKTLRFSGLTPEEVHRGLGL